MCVCEFSPKPRKAFSVESEDKTVWLLRKWEGFEKRGIWSIHQSRKLFLPTTEEYWLGFKYIGRGIQLFA